MSAATRADPASRVVLVVDDDEAVRAVAAKVLRKVGYAVLEASGADEAMEIAGDGDHSIDLLLTDVIMPGMGGRELSERLRARQPELRVLFMSAYTEDEIILRGVRVAEVAFVPKPFTLESLASAVEQALA